MAADAIERGIVLVGGHVGHRVEKLMNCTQVAVTEIQVRDNVISITLTRPGDHHIASRARSYAEKREIVTRIAVVYLVGREFLREVMQPRIPTDIGDSRYVQIEDFRNTSHIAPVGTTRSVNDQTVSSGSLAQ